MDTTTTKPERNSDHDALENALRHIGSIADALEMMEDSEPVGSGLSYLADRLHEDYKSAIDAFRRIYRDRDPEMSAGTAAAANIGDAAVPRVPRRESDLHVNFVAEVRHLRALHSTREARSTINFYGLEAFGQPEPPEFEAMASKYNALMAEWCDQRPETAEGVSNYVNLAQTIIGDEILNNVQEAGGCAIVAGNRDLGYALELLASANRWISNLAIDEAIEREREGRQ